MLQYKNKQPYSAEKVALQLLSKVFNMIGLFRFDEKMKARSIVLKKFYNNYKAVLFAERFILISCDDKAQKNNGNK